LGDVTSRLKLLRGKMVLEIKPLDGDKGTAIAAFMTEPPFAGRTPVFVGDDVTDEDGFLAVNALGGVSVKVNAGPSSAGYRLPDTDAVIDWLEELVAAQ
jgi:trehalose 6-phosphate phosphatase